MVTYRCNSCDRDVDTNDEELIYDPYIEYHIVCQQCALDREFSIYECREERDQ